MGWGPHGEISTLMRPAARAAHTPPEDLARRQLPRAGKESLQNPTPAGTLTAYSQAPDL